jgi:hypothetical protein
MATIHRITSFVGFFSVAMFAVNHILNLCQVPGSPRAAVADYPSEQASLARRCGRFIAQNFFQPAPSALIFGPK